MAFDFQIQEMVHQDSDGVIFQALDKQTGRLVALRRFFLSDDVVKELKVQGEDGKSVFEGALEWLKSLNIPNLQKVVGGGFDELDETPYLVTEWVEGMSLEKAFKQQSLAPGEGERLEAQARAVLLALPEEKRPAICLEEAEILVRRDAAGGLDAIFLISPLHFFGGLGGMKFKEVDRQAALVELRSRFPAAAVAVNPAAASVAVPELKSAKQSSGMGMIWGLLAAVLMVAGIGGWLVMSRGSDAEENTAQEEVIPADEPELAAAEDEEVVEPLEPKNTSVAVTSATGQVEMLEEQVRRAQGALEEKPVAMTPSHLEGLKIDERRLEGEVDLLGKEGESMEEKPELAVVPESKTSLPVIQSATEVDKLTKLIGEKVLLEGVVERVDRSGGKETIWYLEFNKGTADFMMVTFKHVADKQSGEYSEWIDLTNKKVRVKGGADMITRGGRRPAVVMVRRADLEVLADMKVREIAELPALFEGGGAGGEVVAKGTLVRFGRSDKAGYLIFEEAPGVQARFWLDSDFGSSEEFRKKMGALKGKQIRITGSLQDDPQAGVKVALQIESPEKVELCE